MDRHLNPTIAVQGLEAGDHVESLEFLVGKNIITHNHAKLVLLYKKQCHNHAKLALWVMLHFFEHFVSLGLVMR